MERVTAIQRMATLRAPLRLKRNQAMYVGGPLWHTVDERAQMVRKLSTEFAQIHNLAMAQMGWSPSNSPSANSKVVEKDSRWTWYKLAAFPVLDEWARFRDAILGSWWERFTTAWSTIEMWQERVNSFRRLVSTQFKLDIPEPTPLVKTMWQEGGEAMGEMGRGVAGTLKNVLYIALIGAVAIGLIFVLKGGGKTTAIALRGVAR